MERTVECNGPPTAFIAQVKDALEHVHDFLYLQSHVLNREGWDERAVPETAGQRLRGALLDAIEALDPGLDVPFSAPQARLHNLLHLHYVETMTVQECALELGVSERQAYRDLRRSEESVASLLWAQRNVPAQADPRASHLSSLQEEVDRLASHPCATDVWTLVEQARRAIARLADGCGVEIQLSAPPQPVVVYADPVMAQQIVTGLLSQAVQYSQPGQVSIELQVGEEMNLLQVQYRTQNAEATEQPGQVVAQLADRLGWTMAADVRPSRTATFTVQMRTHGRTILVIDDNEGLVTLLERYLTNHAYRVVAAANGRVGLQLAQALQPHAIVLDVIMPDVDGWEVLQRLRAGTQTSRIPVLLCSVFDDPNLAESLGASACLPKPISRSDLLTALRLLDVV